MKTLFYIISTLAIMAICAGAGSYVKTEKLETRIEYIEKDSIKTDKSILSRLESIDDKLSNIRVCN